jgi:hypothetical protein
MRIAALAALALSLGFLAAAPAENAVAAEYTAPRVAHWRCNCSGEWAHRQYWQWDHRPIWDDPWLVLKPNFWGSPLPHLVPANVWARKWHLPWLHRWRGHRHWRRDP